jgi:hypothetical protein
MEKLITIAGRPATFAAVTLLMLLFLLFILPAEAEKAAAYTPEGTEIDTALFNTPQRACRSAEAYGEEGRRAYIRARWTFDLVWPAAYGAFLLTSIAFGIRRLSAPGDRMSKLILLPFLAIFFDLLENTAATLLMSRYPECCLLCGLALSIATPLKWLFVTASFAAALLLPLSAGIKACRERRR